MDWGEERVSVVKLKVKLVLSKVISGLYELKPNCLLLSQSLRRVFQHWLLPEHSSILYSEIADAWVL